MNPDLLKKLSALGERIVTLHTGDFGLRGGLKCEVKAVADDEQCLDFIGSDGRVDRYNEVIDQKGWQLENFLRNPVIPDCHNYDTVARILGRAESVEVRDGKLFNRVRFAMDNPLGAMAFKMAKAGFIPAQSVGFIPLEWDNGVGRDQPDRTYTKCELLEISLVVVPANPGAVQLAHKSGAVTTSDLSACADYFQQFCSKQGHTDVKPGASGSVEHHAHLLNLARDLRGMLGRN
jgi:HK97 family phage prohead protease